MGLLVKEAPQSSTPSCYGRCSRGRAVRKRGRLSPDPHLLAQPRASQPPLRQVNARCLQGHPVGDVWLQQPQQTATPDPHQPPQARATTAVSTGLLSGHFTPMTHRTWPLMDAFLTARGPQASSTCSRSQCCAPLCEVIFHCTGTQQWPPDPHLAGGESLPTVIRGLCGARPSAGEPSRPHAPPISCSPGLLDPA